MDYLVEDRGEMYSWSREMPWVGQTALIFHSAPPPPSSSELETVPEEQPSVPEASPGSQGTVSRSAHDGTLGPGGSAKVDEATEDELENATVTEPCAEDFSGDADDRPFHEKVEMVFTVDEVRKLDQPGLCVVCQARPQAIECGCCGSWVGDSRCLLRHTEGRYQVHRPDEGSKTFERMAAMTEPEERQELRDPATSLVLISPFDGIGGARRALELLGIRPALHISFEIDQECQQVVKACWGSEPIEFGDLGVTLDSPDKMIQCIQDSNVDTRLVVGGPPCQGFWALNRNRKGFGDKRSNCIQQFADLVRILGERLPGIRWDSMMENVSSMTAANRKEITARLRESVECYPLYFDAKLVGPVSRDRLYWPSFSLQQGSHQLGQRN